MHNAACTLANDFLQVYSAMPLGAADQPGWPAIGASGTSLSGQAIWAGPGYAQLLQYFAAADLDSVEFAVA